LSNKSAGGHSQQNEDIFLADKVTIGDPIFFYVRMRLYPSTDDYYAQ